MLKPALPLVLVVLGIATGCPRLAEPFDELGDEADEANGESSETVSMDTAALDAEFSDDDPAPDLPAEGESSTGDCGESEIDGLYLLALETSLAPTSRCSS